VLIDWAHHCAYNARANPSQDGDAKPPVSRPATDFEIAGLPASHHLHYGMTADSLTQSVQLANAGLTRYALGNLSSGTWYFRISAYTTTGVESAVSPVVSDTFL
jgi:hypothetical protein